MGGFRKFLLRGNVVDLAIAVVIGAAFSDVVKGFVDAFVTPLVVLFTGGSGDLARKTFSVSGFGQGRVVFPYGVLLQAAVRFVIVAAVIYFIVVLPVNRLMEHFRTEPEVASPTRECPECLSKIPVAATRCAFCTVEQ